MQDYLAHYTSSEAQSTMPSLVGWSVPAAREVDLPRRRAGFSSALSTFRPLNEMHQIYGTFENYAHQALGLLPSSSNRFERTCSKVDQNQIGK